MNQKQDHPSKLSNQTFLTQIMMPKPTHYTPNHSYCQWYHNCNTHDTLSHPQPIMPELQPISTHDTPIVTPVLEQWYTSYIPHIH